MTARTKPWEENWATDGETIYLRGEDHERVRPFARLYEPLENGDGWAEERAELAALAPRMARMLYEIEWKAGDDRGDACPVCWNAAETGHTKDCKLKKLLVEIEKTVLEEPQS